MPRLAQICVCFVKTIFGIDKYFLGLYLEKKVVSLDCHTDTLSAANAVMRRIL